MLVVLIALLPLWSVGMFGRGYWTPDEPREADIAWRMSVQADHTLPYLGDTRFLEKPPLSYWMAGAAIHIFGASPIAARLPNFLYAVISVLAIGWLVYWMTDATAACISALVAGSSLTLYQVAIWLAPDAALMAGCAIALLGLYRGYIAPPGRVKLGWYALMHIGALIGFMAKSGPGWLLPGLTLFTLVVWEGHWRELLRWELWVGVLLQVMCIGAWLLAVLSEPDGADALRILFWHNLVGRFADLHAVGTLDYASGHKNWPGKYLVELPYHFFPWTLLGAAALGRAWRAAGVKGAAGTSWRFAVAASMPFILLLSLATTARGIYIAPAMLGLSVLIGLWFHDMQHHPSDYDEMALRGTRFLIVVTMAVMVIAVCVLTLLSDGLHAAVFFMVALVIAMAATTTLTWSAQKQRLQQFGPSLAGLHISFCLIVAVGCLAIFSVVNRWQNLDLIARAVREDTKGKPLALLEPDETTIAMLDYRSEIAVTMLQVTGSDPLPVIENWFESHSTDARVLIKLPGFGAGELSPLLERLHRPKSPSELLSILEKASAARVVAEYELPNGRRYALLGPPKSAAP